MIRTRNRWRVGGLPEIALVSNQFLSPSVAFTRSGNGWAVNSAGTLTQFGTDAPRYDFDPGTLAYRGMLGEPTRTNNVRNPRGEGVAAGSPGTAPTFFALSATPAGLTRTITTGTTNGIPWFGIRMTGIAGASAFYAVLPENYGTVAAVQNQTWAFQTWDQLVVYSGTSPTTQFNGGTTGNADTTALLNTSSVWTLRTATLLLASAAPASVYQRHIISIVSGQTYDFELRVGGAQMEQAAYPTSLILPPVSSPAISTRNADSISVTLANIGMPGGFGTYWGRFSTDTGSAAEVRGLFQADDGTDNNRWHIQQDSASGILRLRRTNAGVAGGPVDIGTPTGGVEFGLAWSYASDGTLAASFNGGAEVTLTGAVTSGLTAGRLMRASAATGSEWGRWARTLSASPAVLRGAALQARAQ